MRVSSMQFRAQHLKHCFKRIRFAHPVRRVSPIFIERATKPFPRNTVKEVITRADIESTNALRAVRTLALTECCNERRIREAAKV